MESTLRIVAPACALLFGAVVAPAQEPRPGPPAAAKAAREPVTITADRMEGYANREASASGNAQLRRGNVSVDADRLFYLYASDELQASGAVRLTRDGNVMRGTGLRLRVGDNVGQLDKAEYEFTQHGRAGETPLRAHGGADLIKLEGKDKYRLENATFSTCAPGKNDWYLQVGELDLDMTRNLGTARRGKLVFKDVPLAYLPWADFSLNNERKTGFLPPLIGSSGKSGVQVSTPFYVNLAPNRDLTVTPREYSKRGLQLGTQFRYLEVNYEGDLRYERLLNDHLTDTSRFATTIQHNQQFGSSLKGYLNINKVSDDNYFRDLSSRINITSQATLPRDGMLTYNGGWWLATARAQRFQTLQDPSNPVVTPYDRLPQFTLNATRQYVGGVDLGWASEFVKFDRAAGAVGTTPGLIGATGVAGTSDVVGSRLTLYPSASLPLIAPGGYITPKLGFHSTNYSLARNPVGTPETIQRSLPIASVDSGLTFERDTSFVGQSLRQTLEPRVYYLYVPFKDQSQVPLFDTALADFNYAQIFSENVFSGGDRVADANQLTVAATTRMLSRSSGQEMLKATLGQRYYLRNQLVALNTSTATRNTRTSDFLAAVNGRISRYWSMDGALQYNPQRNFLNRLGIGARYQPETVKVLNIGYRFSRGSDQLAPLNQIDVSAQWPLSPAWSGVGRYNYSLYDRRLVEGLGGFEYNAGCWISRIVVQRFASATGTFTSAVFLQLELNGLSRIGSNPLETLKRNIPGYGRVGQTRPDSKAFDFFE